MDRARRAIPVSNHLTFDKHRRAQHKKHRRKVSNVKCSVDASIPRSHATRRPNVKREQILEERYYEIERDNRHLLRKIYDMYNEPHESKPDKNKRIIQNDRRRIEMKRITKENQLLAARIQNCKPTFSSMDMVKHAKRHEKRMVNACHLPIALDYIVEQKKGEGGRVLPGVSPRRAKGLPTSPLRRPMTPKTTKSELSPNKARVHTRPISDAFALPPDILYTFLLECSSTKKAQALLMSFLPYKSLNCLPIVCINWKVALVRNSTWLYACDIGRLEHMREEVSRLEEERIKVEAQVEKARTSVQQSSELVRRSAERVALQTTLCSEAMSDYEKEMKQATRAVYALDPEGVAYLRDLEDPSDSMNLIMSLLFVTIFGDGNDSSWDLMKHHLFPNSKTLKNHLYELKGGNFVVGESVRQALHSPDLDNSTFDGAKAAQLVYAFMNRISNCHDIRERLEPALEKLDDYNILLEEAHQTLSPVEENLHRMEAAYNNKNVKLVHLKRICNRYSRQMMHMQQPQNRVELSSWSAFYDD